MPRVSIGSELRPERDRQAEQPRRTPPTENAISTTTSPTVSSGRLSRDATRADQHQRGDRGDQAEMRQRHAEQRDGDKADDDGPGVEARHRRAIDGEGAQPR